jgi:hypothetical protein
MYITTMDATYSRVRGKSRLKSITSSYYCRRLRVLCLSAAYSAFCILQELIICCFLQHRPVMPH